MSQATLLQTGCFTYDDLQKTNANFTELYAVPSGGAALTSGQIIVGSAGNVATAVTMSGDVTIVASGATTIKTSVSLTTPVLGAATGTSLVLSGDCTAATYHAGATAGVTAGPFTTLASIRTVAGIVTVLTGS